ncbi:MAG TPA: hypothetical protein VGJ33_03580 [Candidatus Angelobacter sp.]
MLFFMLAIRIARTWIQGLSDLVEVLFTTPLRTNIVIILPVRKHIASGKVHLGVRTPFGVEIRHIKMFIPGEYVCSRALGSDEATTWQWICQKESWAN